MAAVILTACWGEPAPSATPEVQRIVDHYAPGIRIGDRVSAAARAKYGLRVAPYLGYRDSTYVGPELVQNLGVGVNEYVDDGNPTVSRWARVTEVTFQVRDTQTLGSVRRRLIATLGDPVEVCHLSPNGRDRPASRLHRLRWEGRGHGAVMAYAYSLNDAPRSAGTSLRFQFGWISFGAEPSTRGSGLDVIPCT